MQGTHINLTVYDRDLNEPQNDLLIEVQENLTVGDIQLGVETTPKTYMGSIGYSNITLSFYVTCAENWYGPYCNIFSQDYTCDLPVPCHDNCVGVVCTGKKFKKVTVVDKRSTMFIQHLCFKLQCFNPVEKLWNKLYTGFTLVYQHTALNPMSNCVQLLWNRNCNTWWCIVQLLWNRITTLDELGRVGVAASYVWPCPPRSTPNALKYM